MGKKGKESSLVKATQSLRLNGKEEKIKISVLKEASSELLAF